MTEQLWTFSYGETKLISKDDFDGLRDCPFAAIKEYDKYSVAYIELEDYVDSFAEYEPLSHDLHHLLCEIREEGLVVLKLWCDN